MNILVTPAQPNRSGNQYLIDIINANKSMPVNISDFRLKRVLSAIQNWAGGQLSSVSVSGSSAKGTSIKGSSDIDIFVSLKSNTGLTLREIFESLHAEFHRLGFKVRKQNVSVRIWHNSLQIDIVPGKKLPYQTHWHFLYTNRREDQERVQTNVNNHVNHVISSGRINEILALKIWKKINRLDFPSFYLEMYTIDALHGKWSGKTFLMKNFLYVLEHIAQYFPSTAVYDPSNTNNTISHTLYKYQKEEIQKAAINSLRKAYLSEIVF